MSYNTFCATLSKLGSLYKIIAQGTVGEGPLKELYKHILLIDEQHTSWPASHISPTCMDCMFWIFSLSEDIWPAGEKGTVSRVGWSIQRNYLKLKVFKSIKATSCSDVPNDRTTKQNVSNHIGVGTKISYLAADCLTCNFEALYIGIVKFMFTGPASFVRFPVFHKDACQENVVWQGSQSEHR
jgi:hypothetical protein